METRSNSPAARQLLAEIAPTVHWYWRLGSSDQEALSATLKAALSDHQSTEADLIALAQEIYYLAKSYHWAQGGAEQRQALAALSDFIENA